MEIMLTEEDIRETGGITTTAANNLFTRLAGGTSISTPIVSGIIALLLQARPDLSWRDVQHILVKTAVQNDKNNPEAGWDENGVHPFSHKLGFGRINAKAAIDTARHWELVPKDIKTPIQKKYNSDGFFNDKPITISENRQIEFVEVTFSAAGRPGERLDVRLRSPSGTESILIDNDDKNFSNPWIFASIRHFDEPSLGDWELKVDGARSFDWDIEIYGPELQEVPPERSYVREVKVSTGEKPIYHAGWEPVELEDGEEPQIAFAYYAEPQEPVAGTAAQIEIHTSEAMQGMEEGEEKPSIRFAAEADVALEPCEGHQDGTCWLGALTVPDTDDYQLTIQGQDMNEKPLLPFVDTTTKLLSHWTEETLERGDTVHRLQAFPSFAWHITIPTEGHCRSAGGGLECLFDDGAGSVILRPQEGEGLRIDMGASTALEHAGSYRLPLSHGGSEPPALEFAVNMPPDASWLGFREPESRKMWCQEVPDDAPGVHGPPSPSEPDTTLIAWEVTATPDPGADRCVVQVSFQSEERVTVRLSIQPHSLCETLEGVGSGRYELTAHYEWGLAQRSLYSEMLEEKDAWRRVEDDTQRSRQCVNDMWNYLGFKYVNDRIVFERANPDWKQEPEDRPALPIIEPGDEGFEPRQLLSVHYVECHWDEAPICRWRIVPWGGCCGYLGACVEPDSGTDCQSHAILSGGYSCDTISRFAQWEGMATCLYVERRGFLCFTLTAAQADVLADAGVPSMVLENLLQLHGQRFCAEPDFLEALETAIGPDDVAEYGPRILAAAREFTPESPDDTMSFPVLSRAITLHPAR